MSQSIRVADMTFPRTWFLAAIRCRVCKRVLLEIQARKDHHFHGDACQTRIRAASRRIARIRWAPTCPTNPIQATRCRDETRPLVPCERRSLGGLYAA